MILDYKPLNGCLPHELETILRLQPVEDRAALVYTAIKPKKKESTSSQVAAIAGAASVAKNKSPRNNYHSGGHREEVEKVRYKFKQFDVESQEKWYFLADDTTEQENFCFAEEMFPESDDDEGSTSQSSSSGAASSSDGEERTFSTTSKTTGMSRKIAQQRRKIERLNRKIEKKRKAMIERPMGPTHDMPHKNFDNEEFSAQGLQWNKCGLDRGSTLNTMLEDFTEVKFLTAVASAKSTSSDSKHKLCGSTLLPRRLAFDLFLLQLWPNYDIPVQYVLNAIGEPVLISVKLGREWIRIVDINLQVINDFREMQQLIQSRCYNPRAGRYETAEEEEDVQNAVPVDGDTDQTKSSKTQSEDVDAGKNAVAVVAAGQGSPSKNK
ncbi:unnamed protein product, partial [Amoebophrya sp. A120]|eukprot:GSA120T00009698001.1